MILAFIFAFGACVGSFLNVVVYRLPRGQSLVSPPSRCPRCEHKLAWFDNIPVLGWILLGGKCRYCRDPISSRYPIIEALTGGLFVVYYILFFDIRLGPCVSPPRVFNIRDDWPIFALYMFMISSLLAASLIDAELFIIPLEICWLMAAAGVLVHAIVDTPRSPGSLMLPPVGAAMAVGGTVGWLLTLLLVKLKVFRRSFPQGEPLLDVDREAVARELEEAKRKGEPAPPLPPEYSRGQVMREMVQEMLFMLPALVLAAAAAVLVLKVSGVRDWWTPITTRSWFAGVPGPMLGALVGAAVVWVTRILGTFAFGRVAMGLGDVHLMFGVGAIIGAGATTVAFFIAPFAGMAIALYLIVFGKRREIPYGPYLSLGAALTLLFYCPIAAWLSPGLKGLWQAIAG